MPTVEEKIVLAQEARTKADVAFRDSLRGGRERGLSWRQLARITGLSVQGVRYLTLNLNERRQRERAERQKPQKGARKRK